MSSLTKTYKKQKNHKKSPTIINTISPKKQTNSELTVSTEDNKKNNKYHFTIIGKDGFSKLEFQLKPYQEIFAIGSMMSYLRDGVEKGTLQFSFRGAIGRWLTQEKQIYFLLQGKNNANPQNSKVAFSSFLPGGIGYTKIAPDEEVYLTNKSFIASSPNVKLSSGINIAGLFGFASRSGIFIPKVTISNTQDGHLWFGTYGSIQEHKLGKNESILINSGMFVAIHKSKTYHHLYSIEKLGKSILSTIFGSRHIFGMRIYGPCTVYTQSHDINNLTEYINSRQIIPISYKTKKQEHNT